MLDINTFKNIIEFNPNYEIRINGLGVEIASMPNTLLLIPSAIKSFTNDMSNILFSKDNQLMVYINGMLKCIRDVRIFDTKHLVELYT